MVTDDDIIVTGAITNISVSEGTIDGPGDTALLTGTGLSLTFEDDIAPLFHEEGGVIPYSMVLIYIQCRLGLNCRSLRRFIFSGDCGHNRWCG